MYGSVGIYIYRSDCIRSGGEWCAHVVERICFVCCLEPSFGAGEGVVGMLCCELIDVFLYCLIGVDFFEGGVLFGVIDWCC